MACAHSKFTGEVGVCLATSGPGAIHLLNGLYDAKMDHQSVVAIIGQQARRSLGAHYQQEVDLAGLFKDVAADYVMQASVPEQVRTMVDRAIRIAKAERTVTCIVIPNDLQELAMVEEGPRSHGTIYTGVGYSHRESSPTTRICAAPPKSSTPARRSPCSSARVRWGRRRKCSRWPTCSARAYAKALLGKAVTARRRAGMLRLHRPAGHQAELGFDDGVRHAAHGRQLVPVFRVSAQAGRRQERADRPRPEDALHPLPHRRAALRRRGRDLARPAASAHAENGRRVAREADEGKRQLGKAHDGPRAGGGQPGKGHQPASGCSASFPRACRTTASSPPTAAPRPTGTRAT